MRFFFVKKSKFVFFFICIEQTAVLYFVNKWKLQTKKRKKK